MRGRSSGEVAQAFLSLSSAVAGLAQHIGDLAANTDASNTDFSTTDTAIGGAFDQPGLVTP